MKTLEEIEKIYLEVFGRKPDIASESRVAFYLKDNSAYENARPCDIIKFCKLLGTDNMRFEFESETYAISEVTWESCSWRELTIFKDYWGWEEDREK